ncbi:MAG TPA: hypothetical protein VN854_00090 [Mycoplasmatales bacterium]|jgi:hypothetical protein|nr:hypothetical protein [Mycoplasmatales bacterium]
MKNGFNKEINVNVLILPPFFNRLNFENDECIFFNLDNMVKKDPTFEIFDYVKDNEKKSIMELFKKIENSIFPIDSLESIRDILENDKKVFFINYPTNFKQFKYLNLILNKQGIKISRVIVANFKTFENFEHLKSDYLICPFCFNSFKKKLLPDKSSLICPNDKKEISINLANNFSKLFNDHYLRTNLAFAQELSAANEKGEIEIEISPLIISEDENIEDLLI